MSNHNIYVTGHKHPDSDSICSAIAFANLLNKTGSTAIACRQGPLNEETKKCLEIGLAAAQPWNTVGDIGYAIQKYATSKGYSVVRELGGHGVGIEFHEDPFVAHVGKKGTGMVLVPGMIITIEPMINLGKAAVVIDTYDNWTISTKDGKDSAQWEYTILITEDGNEVLSY